MLQDHPEWHQETFIFSLGDPYLPLICHCCWEWFRSHPKFFRQNNNFRQIHHQHHQQQEALKFKEKTCQSIPHLPIPLFFFSPVSNPRILFGAPSWSSTQRIQRVKSGEKDKTSQQGYTAVLKFRMFNTHMCRKPLPLRKKTQNFKTRSHESRDNLRFTKSNQVMWKCYAIINLSFYWLSLRRSSRNEVPNFRTASSQMDLPINFAETDCRMLMWNPCGNFRCGFLGGWTIPLWKLV